MEWGVNHEPDSVCGRYVVNRWCRGRVLYWCGCTDEKNSLDCELEQMRKHVHLLSDMGETDRSGATVLIDVFSGISILSI